MPPTFDATTGTPRTRRSLIDLLRGLPQTMLVATHDMRLVWDLCPRTVILDGGQIVADGATAALLRDAALMDRHGLEMPCVNGPAPVRRTEEQHGPAPGATGPVPALPIRASRTA